MNLWMKSAQPWDMAREETMKCSHEWKQELASCCWMTNDREGPGGLVKGFGKESQERTATLLAHGVLTNSSLCQQSCGIGSTCAFSSPEIWASPFSQEPCGSKKDRVEFQVIYIEIRNDAGVRDQEAKKEWCLRHLAEKGVTTLTR